jgi:hypothetical protein
VATLSLQRGEEKKRHLAPRRRTAALRGRGLGSVASKHGAGLNVEVWRHGLGRSVRRGGRQWTAGSGANVEYGRSKGGNGVHGLQDALVHAPGEGAASGCGPGLERRGANAGARERGRVAAGLPLLRLPLFKIHFLQIFELKDQMATREGGSE